MKGRVSKDFPSLVGQAGISVWYNGVLWVLGFLGGLQVENKADVTQSCLNFSFVALQTPEMGSKEVNTDLPSEFVLQTARDRVSLTLLL